MSGEATEASCFDRAVDLLSRRAHFESEIRAKLRARRFDADEIEATVSRLAGLGYLDDRATAAQWVAGERRRKPQGRRSLRHRLARKGVPAEIVETALEGFDEEEELDEARRATESWSRRHAWDAARLGRHLDGRGFSKRAILVVLEERPEDVVDAGFDPASP